MKHECGLRTDRDEGPSDMANKNAITGMLSVNDLTEELEILQGFIAHHGFESNPVRVGVVSGKFTLLSGQDAVNEPSEEGYWSEVSELTTDTVVRDLAIKLSREVDDSYALQTSCWGTRSGVIAISRAKVNMLRMAN